MWVEMTNNECMYVCLMSVLVTEDLYMNMRKKCGMKIRKSYTIYLTAS